MARLVYTGERLREIAFPLGGIGAGTVSLGGRGQLRDFEIANRPAKGQAPFRNFFALGVDDGTGVAQARILEREMFPPYTGSRGLPVHLVPGLPRFSEVVFTGEYPLAHLDFLDGDANSPFPVRVSLDALNPMIPGNVDDSGLPVALLLWTLENRTPRPVEALLAAVLSNLVGYALSPWPGDPEWTGGEAANHALLEPGLRGVLMGSERDGGRHPAAGTMALASTWPDTTVQTQIGPQDWPYSMRPFWYQLLGQLPFTSIERAAAGAPGANPTVARRLEAVLGLRVRLEPGAAATLPILLTWHFPNRYVQRPDASEPVWAGNYYTTQFADAAAVARYVAAERERLEQETRTFHRHLFASTVPDAAIDAVSANMSTIRSQTCFRDVTGQFYAYEGCNPDSGCCPMNCTHVWMYEVAVASLYPQLERDMRENAFLTETTPDGRMYFRTRTPRASEPFRAESPSAADGQMAEIVQLWRDYQLCGDKEFLARLWPAARRALEYAWRPDGWDADRDGVMEGVQHNTTDIAYYGPNPFVTFLYLAALRAGAAIARELDDGAVAAAYEELAAAGTRRADDLLWNGEFYRQRLDLAVHSGDYAASHGLGGFGDAIAQPGDDADKKAANIEPYNQMQEGCLTDQLFGLWLASLVDLGLILPRERVLSALGAVYRHNFRRMRDVPTNFMRAFAVNDERGVLFASFPDEPGEMIPLTAVFRAHEVWSGCEYQAACHMIQEGMIAEGETIVEAIRQRHDGSTRNPWNEPECGDHYARAMASYGLLQAYARSHIDLSRGRISISPQIQRDRFAIFFAVEGAWGTVRVEGKRAHVELGSGELTVRELVVDGQSIRFEPPQIVTADEPLSVALPM